MAKHVTGADIFGGMFQNISGYRTADTGTEAAGGQRAAESADRGRKEAVMLERNLLAPFKNHPFRVTEDAQMEELSESIKRYGIKEPILARPVPGGTGYEIISGHRRHYAAGMAGLERVPVRIEELSDDDAAVLMVDSNNKRETLLASEKAWAYRIKAEALRRQGRRTDLIGEGAAPCGLQAAGEQAGDSIRTVQRYIRLTYLDRELLNLVDDGRLSFGAGYGISFFDSGEQACILAYYKEQKALPDVAQTELLAALRKENPVDREMLKHVFENKERKKAPGGGLTLKRNRLQKYFPQDATADYMESVILELLEQWSGGSGGGPETGDAVQETSRAEEPDLQMSVYDYAGVAP